MTTIHDLHDLASTLGVTLHHHAHGTKGWYHHPTKQISTLAGLPVAEYKSTLAHELAHAHYGDTPTGHGYYDQRQEQRADQWAAQLLINPGQLQWLAPWHQDDHIGLAYDLEVTPHLLAVYLDSMTSTH